MSAATLTPPAFTPQRPRSQRLLTASDLATLPREMNGQAVRYELFDGELIVMAPPGGEHGRRQHTIGRVLQIAEDLKLGVAYSETGILIRQNPDRVVGADAAFVLQSELPVRHSREGYMTTIPSIIVEIQSKNDRDSDFQSKCDEYFEAGVLSVWRLDPNAKTLSIIANDCAIRTLSVHDMITDPNLPGFAVPVAAIFA
jgi:Uma2 family endonuclease